MATHLDPASEFGSTAADPVLPMLPSSLAARVGAAEADLAGGGEEECGTPTSREDRIPPALTCPAAPRKPRARARAVPCKRGSPSEDRRLEFFEVTSHGEVERFFRSCADAAKRRRFFCK